MSKWGGAVLIKVKIFNVTKYVRLFILKSELFTDDVLLRLDIIKEFNQCQNNNFKIKQNHKKSNANLIKNVPISNDLLVKIENKYNKVFAKGKFDVSTAKDFEDTINLTKNKYMAKKLYKCSQQDKAEIKEQINELL